LKELAKKHEQKGLTVLAVNVREGETQETVREYVARQLGPDRGTPLRFLQNGAQVAREYGVRGVPATFFLDGKGSIADQLTGFDPRKLDACVEGILP